MMNDDDFLKLRDDFPILKDTMRGEPLIYLDNSATKQKPQCVIDALTRYYQHENANIHRGVYELSENATRLYEETRVKVKHFINAAHAHEIIFVRGATEGINLVASSFGLSTIKANDEILISTMEHHSNIVPWQRVAEQTGAMLKVIPITDSGEIELPVYQAMLSERTKIVALTQASNALGTINPVKRMIQLAHDKGIPVLIDGAQAIGHMSVDVQDLDCDFYVFSGHKMYAPTGVGVIYGKTSFLNAMPPYQSGGDMIESVSFEKTTYNKLPYKFEAGTPHISGVIGLGVAIDYMQSIGRDNIAEHEHALLTYATDKLLAIPGLKIIGQAAHKVGVISFVMDDIHPHDIGTILNESGIAIRAGHHCAMPLMHRFNVPATVRASFGLYNSYQDVDALVLGLENVMRLFQ